MLLLFYSISFPFCWLVYIVARLRRQKTERKQKANRKIGKHTDTLEVVCKLDNNINKFLSYLSISLKEKQYRMCYNTIHRIEALFVIVIFKISIDRFDSIILTL